MHIRVEEEHAAFVFSAEPFNPEDGDSILLRNIAWIMLSPSSGFKGSVM
jgi:hypothetical protein